MRYITVGVVAASSADPQGTVVTADSEDRWTELCRRVANEKNPQKRLAILVEIEMAAREEQEELKLRLRPQIERYKFLTRGNAA